jgi:hypothetical protein
MHQRCPLSSQHAHVAVDVSRKRGRNPADTLRDIVKTCGSKRAMDSHAEVRSMHRRNGLRWSAHFDLRCSLAPKDV